MNKLAARHGTPDMTARAHFLGRLAVSALHAELACSPKPGLVTPFSRGSHQDMDARTFMRSLFALRGYFVAIALQASASPAFAPLRRLGVDAEHTMLAATGNINTHRGAIFSLGLLVAAAARLQAPSGRAASAEAVCHGVRRWCVPLLHAPLDADSPGQRARARHGVAGVREQAAEGFPLLRDTALPTLRGALAEGLPRDTALVQTLMSLVASTDDLNLLHRGGSEGLKLAKAHAAAFLASGGVRTAGWEGRMAQICADFEHRGLSPGGSADLLACSLFLLWQEPA